jgi:hypothetical protein
VLPARTYLHVGGFGRFEGQHRFSYAREGVDFLSDTPGIGAARQFGLNALPININIRKGIATKRVRVAFSLLEQFHNTLSNDQFY